ncbi:50S ribosomal protein L19 [Patescibacteria group bacterium]|nr:50S ribosomal protein L19 [Patescibacteria group bacterium]
MVTKIEKFLGPFLKKDLPDIRSGDTVKVYQKIREKGKERIQVFEGVVLARKHGKGIGATITVRKIISGIGVERIFPLHSPTIEKIEITKRGKVRRAKLYYLRKVKGKKAKLKRKEFVKATTEEKLGQKSEEIKEIK